jgi:threonine synthase
MWRYEELLPFKREAAIELNSGATPLIDCPYLAEKLGVERVLFKDEGRNPTGTFKDRGQTMAITAAVQDNASDIALASAGNAGHAAAAYAARAGLDSHVFLPERAGTIKKSMVEVHGGDLTVVGGQLTHAGAAFEDALDEHDNWYSTQTFVTPYRHEGKKTMFYEISEQMDWEVPDSIVYPMGGGVGLVGMHKAAKEFRKLGLTDSQPKMYAAQASGCAPIVRAWKEGAEKHDDWDEPATLFGGIAVSDPGASPLILDAIEESNGGAVATTDDEILDSAIDVTQNEGLEIGATCAAATSGAAKLAENDEFNDNDTIVILNTGAANKQSDILRSHLMEQNA